MNHVDLVETPQETAEGLHDQESAEALATTINPDQDGQENFVSELEDRIYEDADEEALEPEPSPTTDVVEVSQDEDSTGSTEDAGQTQLAPPESESAEAEPSEPPLPPNVTDAPQHPEHIDLRKVKANRKWLRVYLKVSDDEGDLLGDKKLEREIIQCCDELSSLDLSAEEDPDALIARIKEVIERYQKTINLAENTSVGTITKYRIRLGMLYSALKVLVSKKMGYLWTVWFKKNFGDSQFRSAEDYMRLAEVRNCIRYAVFGKERLIQILPHLNDSAGEDPIGDFLSENGIDFDPGNVSEYTEIRTQTDIAIGLNRLAKAGLAEIGRDKVEAFIRNGIELEPKHVKALLAAKNAGKDVCEEMTNLISSGGKVERSPATPEAKAENFKKALARVADLAKDALEDSAYLRKVNLADIRALKNQLVALENQLAAISMPN
jgi:hypothetical protein